MTKIILVRHGETSWNLEKKYQGHADISLTETGLLQAQLVAKRLKKHYHFDAIYSSDLCRAFKTAESIAKLYDKQVISIPELREINFGEWEGLNYEAIDSRYPDSMNKLFTSPGEVDIPGGETFEFLKTRAMKAIHRLCRLHSNQTIAIVSHGGTIRTILCAVLNLHLNYLWNIKQDNTAVNVIEFYGDQVIVSLVNDTHHLYS